LYALAPLLAVADADALPPLLRNGSAHSHSVHHVRDYVACLRSVTAPSAVPYDGIRLSKTQLRYQQRVFKELHKVFFPLDLLIRLGPWIAFAAASLVDLHSHAAEEILPPPHPHADADCSCHACVPSILVVASPLTPAQLRQHLATLFAVLHRAGIGHDAVQWVARYMGAEPKAAALLASLYIPHLPAETHSLFPDNE
jgi:hypothetical protein